MYSARTKLACEIAGVDPLRLNEDHHHGVYPCLPGTIAGKARVFQVHDIVALRVFAILVTAGLSRSVSGEIACKVQHVAQFDQPRLRHEPKLESVTAYIIPEELQGAYDENIRYEYFPLEHFPSTTVHEWLADQSFGSAGDASPISFNINVKAIREGIVRRLEAEARVLGED